MSKKMKIWLWAAVSLILGGCVIFGVAMTMLNWDFQKLSTMAYETNQYEITEEYENIYIATDTADITFAVSEDGKHRVTCYEQENATHSVAVKDGNLVIELADSRTWYEHLGISFTSPKITIYLPQEQYGNLSIHVSTGDVTLAENFSFETINISVSTGKITVANVTCESLTSNGSTGDIDLKNVVATGAFFIERSTGDIELERCDAATLYLKTSTGDIEGSLRSGKVFSAHTETGDVEIPRSTTGGTCEIYTSTGDIEIEIER